MTLYPWPSKKNIELSILILLSSSQKRHGKGSNKGGQFKGDEIPVDMPITVRSAKIKYKKWNGQRVKLAKLKKRYKDSGVIDEKIESQIKTLDDEVTYLKSSFEKSRERANSKGYKIDSRSNWTNPSIPVEGKMRPVGKTGRVNYRNVDTTNDSDVEQQKALNALTLSIKPKNGVGADIPDNEANAALSLNPDSGQIRMALSQDMITNSKRNVITNLAKKAGLTESETNDVIHEWSIDSNRTVNSMSMQQAARDEFGVPLSDFQETEKLKMEKEKSMEAATRLKMHGKTTDRPNDVVNLELDRDKERKLLRTMYDETQSELENLGIDEITLYRGFRDYDEVAPKSGNYDIEQSAMSSWSADPDTALSFGGGLYGDAGRLVKAVVPRSRILSCAGTGFGCLEEAEFVVLGSNEPETVSIYAKPSF